MQKLNDLLSKLWSALIGKTNHVDVSNEHPLDLVANESRTIKELAQVWMTKQSNSENVYPIFAEAYITYAQISDIFRESTKGYAISYLRSYFDSGSTNIKEHLPPLDENSLDVWHEFEVDFTLWLQVFRECDRRIWEDYESKEIFKFISVLSPFDLQKQDFFNYAIIKMKESRVAVKRRAITISSVDELPPPTNIVIRDEKYQPSQPSLQLGTRSERQWILNSLIYWATDMNGIPGITQKKAYEKVYPQGKIDIRTYQRWRTEVIAKNVSLPTETHFDNWGTSYHELWEKIQQGGDIDDIIETDF